MDSFLSLPIPRWVVIVERTLASFVLMAGILLITLLGVAIGIAMVPNVAYELGGIAAGMLNLYPSLLFVLGMTVLAGVLFRRRNVAMGVAATIVVASYMIDFIASGAPDSAFANVGYLSFFRYYDGVGVVQSGLNAVNMSLLVVAAVALIGLALWRFQKRDIGL